MYQIRLAGPGDAAALLGLRRQALVRGCTVIDEYYLGKLLAGDGTQ